MTAMPPIRAVTRMSAMPTMCAVNSIRTMARVLTMSVLLIRALRNQVHAAFGAGTGGVSDELGFHKEC